MSGDLTHPNQEQRRIIAAQTEQLSRQQESIEAQRAEVSALAVRLRGLKDRLGESSIIAASPRR